MPSASCRHDKSAVARGRFCLVEGELSVAEFEDKYGVSRDFSFRPFATRFLTLQMRRLGHHTGVERSRQRGLQLRTVRSKLTVAFYRTNPCVVESFCQRR